MKKKNLCLIPEAKSLGGPRTFQQNLISWATNCGMAEVHFDAERDDIDAFLVIGGPKKNLPRLIQARRKGIPVVQRLNGMNWIHRVRPSGLKYSLHSEEANLAIAFYRRFVCNKIIYQSPFCEQRWNKVYGELSKPSRIIFNGTDLQKFHPGVGEPDFGTQINFVLAEGSFRYGMDFGLDAAAELALGLADRFSRSVSFHVAGKITKETENRIHKQLKESGKPVEAIFEGVVDREKLIRLEQNAAFFFSSEIHAACPNAVIEALGCGLPVIGFDTGALKDVTGDAGIIVPFGSDPWKLEKPVCGPLIDAAEKVIRKNIIYRTAARSRAESCFSIDDMAQAYLDFCLD